MTGPELAERSPRPWPHSTGFSSDAERFCADLPPGRRHGSLPGGKGEEHTSGPWVTGMATCLIPANEMRVTESSLHLLTHVHPQPLLLPLRTLDIAPILGRPGTGRRGDVPSGGWLFSAEESGDHLLLPAQPASSCPHKSLIHPP